VQLPALQPLPAHTHRAPGAGGSTILLHYGDDAGLLLTFLSKLVTRNGLVATIERNVRDSFLTANACFRPLQDAFNDK
jgi:hypothetical protein